MSGEHALLGLTRALIAALDGSNITGAEWTAGDYRLKLSRGLPSAGSPAAAPEPSAAAPPPRAPQLPPSPATRPAAETVDVPSPVHGVFYAAAEPGAPPLVRLGAEVAANAPLCIVEAMKVLTTIEAPCAGTIAFIGPADGSEIAAGEVLIRIAPIGEP